MDFIKKYIEYTKHYESPTSFWKWSAYAILASVLRDNCYRMFGDVAIYPNIYVLLLAESAAHRKGNPVGLCERYVELMKNTKVISGRSSAQAILYELAEATQNESNGKILKGGSALFSARELSAALVSDPESVKILTDIYDFKADYVSRLRGSGIFRIKNICFTMMAASNEDLLKDVYDVKAMYGGLLGRTFLVKPDEFRKGNSLFDTVRNDDLDKELQDILFKVTQLSGEFRFEAMARIAYESWYYEFRESYKNKVDKAGVAGRIHTGVIKLAMILCVNHTMELLIKKEHVEEAIAECTALIPNYSTFVMGSGRSSLAEVGSTVLTECFAGKNHAISRRSLLAKQWMNIDSETLDKVITTLTEAGMIKQSFDGNEMGFTLTDKCLETMFAGRNGNGPPKTE